MSETKNERTSACFYGVNVLTQEPIMCNRKNFVSSCGIVSGMPGSGKSVMVKHEILQTLSQTEDDIIVIDPEPEYAQVGWYSKRKFVEENCYHDCLSNKIKRIDLWCEENYINPMDLVLPSDFYCNDKNTMETSLNIVIEEKANFIICFLGLLFNKDFDAAQTKPIHDAVVSILKPFGERLIEQEMNYDFTANPTFMDLIDLIESMLGHSPYLNHFSRRTSITDERAVVFGLDYVPERVLSAWYCAIYEYVWNKSKINSKEKNSYTWLYLEGAHIPFNTCRNSKHDFITNTFKQHKTNKIICTLIVQSISYLLENAEMQSVINNSGFMFYLSQAPKDREFIKQMYSLSDELLEYIKDKPSGMGILFNGQNWTPFDFDMRSK